MRAGMTTIGQACAGVEIMIVLANYSNKLLF